MCGFRHRLEENNHVIRQGGTGQCLPTNRSHCGPSTITALLRLTTAPLAPKPRPKSIDLRDLSSGVCSIPISEVKPAAHASMTIPIVVGPLVPNLTAIRSATPGSRGVGTRDAESCTVETSRHGGISRKTKFCPANSAVDCSDPREVSIAPVSPGTSSTVNQKINPLGCRFRAQ